MLNFNAFIFYFLFLPFLLVGHGGPAYPETAHR